MNGSFGRYELGERLGVGAWGEVFKAKSFGVEGFEKTLIVKRVLPELARHRVFVEAFLREAKNAVRLSHANIAQVFDLGRTSGDSGDYYLAGEFVAGVDLERVLAHGELPLEASLHVASEIAKALDHGHRRQDSRPIVHGDLTPANVQLSWDGEVKVLDYAVGLALFEWVSAVPSQRHRLTAKLPYTSPELCDNQPLSGQSDVFALGALMYRLLAQRPVEPAVASEALGQLRPDLPEVICSLVERCLQRDPAARPDAARVYEEILVASYALPVRFGDAELSELLERLGSRAEPMELSEQLLDDDEEDDVPKSLPLSQQRLAPPVPESLQRLATFRDHADVVCLMVSYRVTGLRAAQVRDRTASVALRYGGRPLEDGEGFSAFVFGLDAEDMRGLHNAALAALVALRAVGPLARPGAVIVTGTVRVNGQLVEAGPEREALLASAAKLAESAAGRVLASAASARGLRHAFGLAASDVKDVLVVGQPEINEIKGPFVGRRHELRWLSERLGDASRVGLVVAGIVGPHGIGKTRLLREAERRVKRAALSVGIFVAQCAPGGRGTPFAGVIAMLRALTGVRDGDSLDGVMAVEPRLRSLGLTEEEAVALLSLLGVGPAGSASQVRSGFCRVLSSLATERVHVFAWDDAQELDSESIDVLADAAERLSRARLVLLFSGRQGTSTSHLPGYQELDVGELELADTERLVAARLGVDAVPAPLFRFLTERGGGHPMFVEELLRQALDTRALVVSGGEVSSFAVGKSLVPSSLKSLLSARFRGLTEAERGLLVAVAVLEPPAELAVVALMLDLPLGTLQGISEGLVSSQILEWSGTSHVVFHTPLLREVLLSEPERQDVRDLHERAADAWQVVLGPRTEEQSHLVGHHLALAGQEDRAAGFFATSGFYHMDARRLDVAARDFTQALSLAHLGSRGSGQIAEWVSALSHAMRHVRAGSKLPELVQKLSGYLLLDKNVDVRDRGRMVIDLALALGAVHRYKEARRMLQRAADAAASFPDLARAALLAEAELAIRQGEMKLAEQALARAKELPPTDAAEQHRLLVLTAQAGAGAGHVSAAEEALAEAERQVPAGDVVLAGERAKVRALAHGFRGEWRQCADASADAAEQMRRAGLLHEAAVNLHNQGDSLMRLGEHGRAYAVLKSSQALSEEIGSERLVNLNGLMIAYLDAVRGSEGGKDALLRALTRAEAQKWTWDVVTGRYLLGRLFLLRGDRSSARRELTLARSLANSTHNRVLAQDCEVALGEL